MLHTFETGLLWFLALGCGLMAGVYFAFSAFIMMSLSQAGPQAGVASMNAINDVIVRTSFLPLFLGTSAAAVIAAILAALHWQGVDSLVVLAGAVIYIAGMFLVTTAFNVPLNNALAAEGERVWADYLSDWTRWNHLRTAASLIAAALFVDALVAR